MANLKEAQNKIQALMAEFNHAFPERSGVIMGLFIAFLIKKHVFLIGPPATAKTLILKAFAAAMAEGSFFKLLFTKYTTPEEIFGPLSYKGLTQDLHVRKLDGYAIEKRMWVFDEIWKGSSAILNTNLEAVQEFIYKHGTTDMKIPLEMLTGAANEYPQDKSLDPMYDRFNFRFWVERPVERKSRGRIFQKDPTLCKVIGKMTQDEIDVLRQAITDMDISDSLREQHLDIEDALTAEGFKLSPRFTSAAGEALKAMAIIQGRDHIITSDFMIFADMVWNRHTEREKAYSVIGNAADPFGSRAEAILDGVRIVMRDLPTVEYVKTGRMTEAEFMEVSARVKGKVKEQKTKLKAVIKEANGDKNERIEKVEETIQLALRDVSKAISEIALIDIA